jgi:hypothetical protein
MHNQWQSKRLLPLINPHIPTSALKTVTGVDTSGGIMNCYRSGCSVTALTTNRWQRKAVPKENCHHTKGIVLCWPLGVHVMLSRHAFEWRHRIPKCEFADLAELLAAYRNWACVLWLWEVEGVRLCCCVGRIWSLDMIVCLHRYSI